MVTDFHDAHLRHLSDADTLYIAQRWANADHLYGLSAECGLKALMLKFGMLFDNRKNKPTNRDDMIHADKIWTRYESYRSGHHLGINYQLTTNNPFASWEVNQRYEHQSSFSQHRVDPHKQGAECVKALVKKAQLEGLI